MKARYRFYRVHKFVIAFINDITRMIAKTDFCDHDHIQKLKHRIEALIPLLQTHAEHEDAVFHSLLEVKGSTVHKSIADDHQKHASIFENWMKSLEEILKSHDPEGKKQQGYEFYLAFREFEANNLIHLNNEENLIMPELQRLYSDSELKAVTEKTYQKNEMTPEAMVGMMKAIFPYMDRHDRLVFLDDIYQATPDKFIEAFSGILELEIDTNNPILKNDEAKQLMEHFSLTEEDLSVFTD